MFERLKNIRLRTPVVILAAGIVFFLLIGFVENKQQHRRCKGIDIQIEDAFDTYFINDADVEALLTHNGTEPIEGKSFDEIKLKNLELRLKTNKFVRNCQVYADLTGKLHVQIQQNRPIARILDSYAPDAYISENGGILPLSERFTARVMLVEGPGLKRILHDSLATDSASRGYLELMHQVDTDRFFKALIAQIYIDAAGDIQLYPQLGKQVIEFGKPTDLDEKFKKIKIFYQKVLPVQGWNRYSRVNVAYKNQLVCE